MGPLRGGMPLYKYLGNRVLTAFENRALGLNLTEFHSGYRAYNVHALSQIRLDNLADEFHFDTEIIIKLHHQNFKILEVPIPTFYGDEICYVNGLKYAKAILRAVYRYMETSRAVRCYPEYEEYFVPYAIKRSLYSAHYYAARLIGRDQRVLELRRKPTSGKMGTDFEPSQFQIPGNNVIEADIETGLSELRKSGQEFDRILALDILEHLENPSKLLQDCRRLLSARGKLIVSVPNAVNLTVRLMVLFGNFRYADRGILDWSHLRFFTAKTIRALLEEHGYRVTGHHYTIMPLERLIPMRSENRLLRFGNKVLRVLTALAPGLLAYEILLIAER